ncbi:MAG: hypothetical protein V1676_02750 [Candidatus Diapherotrites archaeon]
MALKKTIKYFMWGFQHHFCGGLEVEAGLLFERLSPKLNPKVFLIGVLEDEGVEGHPVCVEPEDCGISVDAFANIKERASALYESHPNKNMWHSVEHAHKIFHAQLQDECFSNAVQEILDKHFGKAGISSFLSHPIVILGYKVIVVLQFKKIILGSLCFLSKDKHLLGGSKHHEINLSRSLLESVIHVFLRESFLALRSPMPGQYLQIMERDYDEIIRDGGVNFMTSIALRSSDEGYSATRLFPMFHSVSALNYEGRAGSGRLIISKKGHPNVKTVLLFKHEIRLSNSRGIRALLELTTHESYLLTNGEAAYGVGELQGTYGPDNEDLFVVEFEGHYNWKVLHNHKTVMVVKAGYPSVSRPPIDTEKFKSDLQRIFTKFNTGDIELLWELSTAASHQKHGALLIISDGAAEEAVRLSGSGTLIAPIKVTSGLIGQITSIDGAILLDKHCTCYAVGAILDGDATSKGKTTRGSRYNSAIRYVEHISPKYKSLAIIVSSDGTVDIYPDLLPQISKVELEKHVDTLKEQAELESVAYENIRESIVWLNDHRSYLTKKYCDEANTAYSKIKPKLKYEGLMIVLNILRPNEEIDDSYFIESNESPS